MIAVPKIVAIMIIATSPLNCQCLGTMTLRRSAIPNEFHQKTIDFNRKYELRNSERKDLFDDAFSSKKDFQSISNSFCNLAPLWTLLTATISIQKSSIIAPTLGSLTIMQNALSTLMLAMGLTITPTDFREAMKKPSIIILNALLCFIMMPLLSIGISFVLQFSPSQTAGIVLLGCVSGGQASNLFAFLAGGDAALSVICTLSTTLVGVLATPFLIEQLLRTVVSVDFLSVLKSVTNLVLIPLSSGLVFGQFAPRIVKIISPICPAIGVLSTLILIAGGASTSAYSLGIDKMSIIASCLLPILGGGLALLLSYVKMPLAKEAIDERSRRTLVVETFSKSPTLAYVLATKHFGPAAATIPAIGMISLAVIGAIVASIWSIFPSSDIDK